MAVVGKVRKDVQMNGEDRRNYFVEDLIDVRDDAMAAGESFGSSFWIEFDRFANFRKGGAGFIVAKKKVAVAPQNFGGEGINALGFEIGRAGFVYLTRLVVVGGEIEKRVGGKRIERAGNEKRMEGSIRIRLFEIILIEAAEKIPIARIGRFELNGAFVAFACVESGGVSGACDTNAVVRKQTERGDGYKKKQAVGARRKLEDHAGQLCLSARHGGKSKV